MGCSPWIPRNSSHRPQYDDTGASRHVESNTVEVLCVSAGFVATDFPSGPRPLPTHAQPACFPRPTKNSEEPLTMVFAALAITRYLTAATGTSIKKFVQTLRNVRSATVEINGQHLTLDPKIPPEAQQLLDAIKGH